MTIISKKTVLIVGDQKRMTDVIVDLLARRHPGFGHVCVGSFAEARNLMNEMEEKGLAPFSLVITSANLPIEQGAERSTIAFRFVIKECDHRGIAFIVFSDFEEPGGFEGPWVTYRRNDAFIFNEDLNAQFRSAMEMN